MGQKKNYTRGNESYLAAVEEDVLGTSKTSTNPRLHWGHSNSWQAHNSCYISTGISKSVEERRKTKEKKEHKSSPAQTSLVKCLYDWKTHRLSHGPYNSVIASALPSTRWRYGGDAAGILLRLEWGLNRHNWQVLGVAVADPFTLPMPARPVHDEEKTFCFSFFLCVCVSGYIHASNSSFLNIDP